ncbi:hypothetical protein IF1G_07683 [Cordyceps javanica]|uniref:Uncharacterized protein n=1 Tax=Cordyceps javanica TaxID=43265 RepID=A0A545UWX3_9HYPO|nr:hypothetical protein IF1G_07683 [Cordyceps javanica]
MLASEREKMMMMTKSGKEERRTECKDKYVMRTPRPGMSPSPFITSCSMAQPVGLCATPRVTIPILNCGATYPWRKAREKKQKNY